MDFETIFTASEILLKYLFPSATCCPTAGFLFLYACISVNRPSVYCPLALVMTVLFIQVLGCFLWRFAVIVRKDKHKLCLFKIYITPSVVIFKRWHNAKTIHEKLDNFGERQRIIEIKIETQAD